MGADVGHLFVLVNKPFISLILVAAVISIPVVHFIVTNWLNTFAYRFNLECWMYALPLPLILVISLIAIMGKSISAVSTNPVDALKDE